MRQITIQRYPHFEVMLLRIILNNLAWSDQLRPPNGDMVVVLKHDQTDDVDFVYVCMNYKLDICCFLL